MKKLISGVIAAFLLSAGFVAVSAETASAACGGTYQPVCVNTKTSAPKTTVPANKKPAVKVQVKANGNVKAVGTITITIKPGGKKVTANIKGGKVTVKLPKLKPGNYKLSISYKPAAATNFKASSTTSKLVVKKKK